MTTVTPSPSEIPQNAPDALPLLRLKAKEDGALRAGRPWIYANQVAAGGGALRALEPGSLARVVAANGEPLGAAAVNPHSLIVGRLLDRDVAAVCDPAFLAGRLARALALRERLFDAPFYRLVHAEGDGLPGLVIDRYGDLLVVQPNSAWAERALPALLAALDELLAPRAVVLRADAAGRAAESLPSYQRLAKGALDGPIELQENGVTYLADPLGGQKTGWYYDQRSTRAFVASLTSGARVLDAFSHSGGFALACLAQGAASALALDSSAPALELAQQAAVRNDLDSRLTLQQGDALAVLQTLRDRGESFDLVVADPPPFVPNKKALPQGLKAYRKTAALAARLVSPGGILSLASCSHNVDPASFFKAVAGGLSRAERSGRVLLTGGAGPDHPVHAQLPETAYLKTLTLQLD